jgi:hypothetical protein
MSPAQTAVNPTWTWGSSASMRLGGAGDFKSSAQLAQVALPEPAVCSLYMQATVTLSDPALAYIGTFTLNLALGLGRVTIPRQISFASQPGPSSPIEWTMPFVPLHALQADVSANLIGDGAQVADIQIYFVISPITRIPQAVQKLAFGMAMPGEADAMDDELRNDLEEESPTVQQIMGREANQRVHGADEIDGDDDDEPEAVPAWMLDIVDALSNRLGRAPNRKELRAAVDRYRQRQTRRGR